MIVSTIQTVGKRFNVILLHKCPNTRMLKTIRQRCWKLKRLLECSALTVPSRMCQLPTQWTQHTRHSRWLLNQLEIIGWLFSLRDKMPKIYKSFELWIHKQKNSSFSQPQMNFGLDKCFVSGFCCSMTCALHVVSFNENRGCKCWFKLRKTVLKLLPMQFFKRWWATSIFLMKH